MRTASPGAVDPCARDGIALTSGLMLYEHMMVLLEIAMALLLGLAVGWRLSPGRYRHFYRTTKPIRVLTKDSRPLCTLPAGTPMLSEIELLPVSDRGWWAYVPIQFDDMQEALDLGIAAGSRDALVSRATLHARGGDGAPDPESLSFP
jgi:hypothetical protein